MRREVTNVQFGMRLWLLLLLPCTNAFWQIPPVPEGADLLGSWYTTVIDIDITCLEMNTWERVVMAFIKEMLSESICPLLRFVSPVTMVIVPMDGMFGWASFDYLPDGGNCRAPPGEVLCMWLNFYIVIFDLIIPLMIINTFVESYKNLLIFVLKGTKHAAVALFKECEELVSRAKLFHFSHERR